MIKKFFFTSSIFFAILLFPFFAHAADMYLVLDKSQVSTGGTFSGTVYISTDQVKINNAEGNLFFPADLVSVDSISLVGSALNIWIEQPTFSNTTGIVSFNGGLPNPGYSGQSGNVLKVNFKAKKAGTASLSFGSAAIRANDGKGTNVFSQARGSTLAIIDGVTAPTTPITPATVINQTSLPKAPVITSTDMPDGDSWYNSTSGTFKWDLPSGTLAVQLVLSKFSDTVPYVNYQPAIKTKTLDKLSEGKLFINARFKNSAGFGPIASRKIQIDLTKPENLSAKANTEDDDTISVEASATDKLSGMASYAVFIGDEKIAETNASTSTNKINLSPLKAGKYDLVVRAYDKAQNYAETSLSINAPVTKSPKITTYPEFIQVNSKFEIQGKSYYGESDIILWTKEEGEEAKSYNIRSNADGIFSFTTGSIRNIGNVAVWAETIRTKDVKSEPSEKVFVNVREAKVVWFATKTIQIISVGITILVLILLFILLILFIIRKSGNLKRVMEKDKTEAEVEMHAVFEMLKKDMQRYLRMLQKAGAKRELTEEEYKIFMELSEEIDGSEKYLSKKIKDIG